MVFFFLLLLVLVSNGLAPHNPMPTIYTHVKPFFSSVISYITNSIQSAIEFAGSFGWLPSGLGDLLKPSFDLN